MRVALSVVVCAVSCAVFWLGSSHGCSAAEPEASSLRNDSPSAGQMLSVSMHETACHSLTKSKPAMDKGSAASKAKWTAKLTASGADEVTTGSGTGLPLPQKYRRPQENYKRKWAVLGPVGAYGPLMRGNTAYRRGW